jgi:hypothetical protein
LGELGGLNLYGYTYNNPINNFDTDGRFVETVGIATTVGTASSGGAGVTVTVTGGGAAGVGIGGAATVGGLVVAVPAAVGLVGYDLYRNRPAKPSYAEGEGVAGWPGETKFFRPRRTRATSHRQRESPDPPGASTQRTVAASLRPPARTLNSATRACCAGDLANLYSFEVIRGGICELAGAQRGR